MKAAWGIMLVGRQKFYSIEQNWVRNKSSMNTYAYDNTSQFINHLVEAATWDQN